MDSLTQIALGSTVAALAVPAGHRRAALLAGALLGTLPDLDTLPLMLIDDPVTRITWHRAPSHSLLVLPFVGWLIWALLRWRLLPVKQAPQRWMWAIQLALLTHPLLDSFTAYGTQLLWCYPLARCHCRACSSSIPAIPCRYSLACCLPFGLARGGPVPPACWSVCC